MNNVIFDFIMNLEAIIKKIKDILSNVSENKKALNTIVSTNNKLTDSVLSLALLKNHEFDILKKKIYSSEKIIEEIELIRYLAIGVVEQHIMIEFTNDQLNYYKKFHTMIQEENNELEKYDLVALKVQLEETEKILKVVKLKKPFVYNKDMLNAIFNGLELNLMERNTINKYIMSICDKKEKTQK